MDECTPMFWVSEHSTLGHSRRFWCPSGPLTVGRGTRTRPSSTVFVYSFDAVRQQAHLFWHPGAEAIHLALVTFPAWGRGDQGGGLEDWVDECTPMFGWIRVRDGSGVNLMNMGTMLRGCDALRCTASITTPEHLAPLLYICPAPAAHASDNSRP